MKEKTTIDHAQGYGVFTAIVMFIVGLYMSMIHVEFGITIIVAVVCGTFIYLYMALKVLDAKIDALTNVILEMNSAKEYPSQSIQDSKEKVKN